MTHAPPVLQNFNPNNPEYIISYTVPFSTPAPRTFETLPIDESIEYPKVYCQMVTKPPFRILDGRFSQQNGSTFSLPVTLDTGCSAPGVISQKVVQDHNLQLDARKARVSVADGRTQMCDMCTLQMIRDNGAPIDLQFVVLNDCPAGVLLGVPAFQYLDRTAYRDFCQRIETAMKPKNL